LQRLTKSKKLLTLVKNNIMQGFEKLANSLLAAKQVMNKVETGSYETGAIDPSMLVQETQQPQPNMGQPTNQRPVNANLSEDRIKNSRLPENIKKLMLENPIPTLDLTNELPSGFIDEVAKKMEQQSQFGAGAQQIKKPQQTQRPTTSTSPLNEDLKNFIKQTIVETLDEIVDSKLNQLMESNKQIDENLQIRVGDSMFIGKITDVRKAK
jgi:hypothetical protein